MLKRMVKKKIVERMKEIVLLTKKGSKKMRYSSCHEFGMKPYIKFGNGINVTSILKTRLHMWEVYGNYKGNYKLQRVCPHCLKEDDTTELLLMCSALGPSLFTVSEIANEENVQLWKQMVERINTNMKWREGR